MDARGRATQEQLPTRAPAGRSSCRAACSAPRESGTLAPHAEGARTEVDGRYVNTRRKGIYLLPNLVTTGGLFAGFYSIVASIDGNFHHAAWAIFAAMLLDGLDGRVARLTSTASEFGKEFDSLADMVSFGLAPAIVVYQWAVELLEQRVVEGLAPSMGIWGRLVWL